MCLCVLQSFETKSLEALAEHTCLPLIQLIGADMRWVQGGRDMGRGYEVGAGGQ